VSVASRLQRLERSRPPCPGCLQAAALVRWRDDADPPEAPPCPTCGRPQPRAVVREVVVTKTADGLQFVAPDWCRFISPSEAAALVHDADEVRWREAEEQARRRRAAGVARALPELPDESAAGPGDSGTDRPRP
jgi:hypothetical protein